MQYEDDQKEIECDDDQKELEYEKEKIIANDIASLQISHHEDVRFIKQSSQPKRQGKDDEYFHMSYLAIILSHPNKNRLIETYGNNHYRELYDKVRLLNMPFY